MEISVFENCGIVEYDCVDFSILLEEVEGYVDYKRLEKIGFGEFFDWYFFFNICWNKLELIVVFKLILK